MNGAQLIAAERRRQREKESWSWQHDDEHDEGEMALAAIAYALPPAWRSIVRHVAGVSVTFELRRLLWPWRNEWKPSPDDRVRELVKAGALIAAEIDRVQRAERRAKRV